MELEGFDDFWRAYPRRVGKQDAMRRYKQALKLASPAEILRAAKIYATECRGKDDHFIKHPSGWLHAGRWGDYPQIERMETKAAFGFYAKFTSPEMEAWTAYGRSIGKSYPKDRSGGWYFPTRWPPGHESNHTQAA